MGAVGRVILHADRMNDTTHEIAPGIVRTVLPSGALLLSESVPSVRSAAVGAWIRTGSRDESPGEAGLSHFLEHILFKGTTTRTAFEISYEVERRGGHIDAFTGRENTCYYARTLDEDLPRAVDVLCDILSRPLFDAEHIEREKSVVLEEIAGVEDMPEDWVQDLFAEALWATHPLGRPVLGSRDSVHGITPEAVRGYWGRRYTADRVIVSVAGRFDLDEVIERVNASLCLAAEGGANSNPPDEPIPPYVTTRRREARDLAQCYMCLGTRGVPAGHPQRPAVMLLSTLLGGGASSRLFQSLRERAGLAYSVYTYADTCREAGVFATSLGVRPENADRALDTVRGEYERLVRDGLDDGELDAAKAQIRTGIMLGLESMMERMEHLAQSEIYRGRYVSPEEQVASVERVTSDQVVTAAHEMLDFDQCSVVWLGPGAA